ncbi:MAG: hypothetical protein ABI140_05480 [Jatrophihabitantaceae bacterium]
MHRNARGSIIVGALLIVAGVVALMVVKHRHQPTPHSTAIGAPRVRPGAFPDASTTGVPAGTQLRKVPEQLTSGPGWKWNPYGWVQVGSTNVTINGLDINGSIHSSFGGLTIQDSRIRCTGENDWCVSIASKTVVRDTEIGGQADGHTFGKATGVLSAGSGAQNVLQGLNIHNTSDGLRLDGGTELIDSWVHDLSMGDIPDAHSDGVQSTGGANVSITGNRIESGNNCNVFVQWLSGQPEISHYQVGRNLFVSQNRNNQQTSYGVCIYGNGVQGPITVQDNTFSRGWQVGAVTAPPEASLSGNKYTDGSATAEVSK